MWDTMAAYNSASSLPPRMEPAKYTLRVPCAAFEPPRLFVSQLTAALPAILHAADDNGYNTNTFNCTGVMLGVNPLNLSACQCAGRGEVRRLPPTNTKPRPWQAGTGSHELLMPTAKFDHARN